MPESLAELLELAQTQYSQLQSAHIVFEATGAKVLAALEELPNSPTLGDIGQYFVRSEILGGRYSEIHPTLWKMKGNLT